MGEKVVDARLEPRSRRGRETRAALVIAARAVFERDGLIEARVPDITSTAGVATGSFYTYFRDKDEAFRAVLELVQEEMLHPGDHLATEEQLEPRGRIESANRRYLEQYRDNVGLMRLLNQVASVDADFREQRNRRAVLFWERNANFIRKLQERGQVPPELDAMATSVALSAMVSQMAYSVFVIRTSFFEFENVVKTVTDIWVHALQITDSTAN